MSYEKDIFSCKTIKIEYNPQYNRYKIKDAFSGSWVSLNKFALRTFLLLVNNESTNEHITFSQKQTSVEMVKIKNSIRLQYIGQKTETMLTLGPMALNQIKSGISTITEKVENMSSFTYGIKRKNDFSDSERTHKKHIINEYYNICSQPDEVDAVMCENASHNGLLSCKSPTHPLHIQTNEEIPSECEKLINDL